MRLVLLILLVILPLVRAAGNAPARPNIVFLLVDDLRWNTLGFMGDGIVQTPHLDRLAARGTVFRQAFVTTSICCVSRASILSGQWERRHQRVTFDDDFSPAQWTQTYPALLRAAGYRTGFIGKFGVGHAKAIAARAKDFDFWRGLPGQGGAFFEKNNPTHTHKTARFGNEALEFLAGVKAGQPFCLSLSFNAVHARDGEPREYPPDDRDVGLYVDTTIPLPPTAKDSLFASLPESVKSSEGRRRWKWRFDSEEKAQRILRDYYRLMTGVDREVGRIVAALEAQGLADNTVILFTSDNGYALGDRGLADKWFAYEEDLRVPLMIYDPRRTEAERATLSDAVILNVDLAPTILALAGLPVPECMQGRSLLPLLAPVPPPADWRTEFFYEHHTVPGKVPPVEAYRTPQWKYIRWLQPNPIEELYEMVADPLEEKNLASEEGHQQTLGELREKWARAAKDLR